MFSISQFKSNLGSIVRPNLFYVEIYIPAKLIIAHAELYGTSAPTDKFKFRCEATELPGRTVATIDDQHQGPNRKFAYEITYTDINFQVIASEDMAERKMFELWMDLIVTPTNRSSIKNGMKGGIIKYHDDYAAGQIYIHQLNDQGKKLCTYTLYRAYPIQLSPMNLSWEEQNTYQRFSVTMTYRYHESVFYKIEPPPPPAASPPTRFIPSARNRTASANEGIVIEGPNDDGGSAFDGVGGIG